MVPSSGKNMPVIIRRSVVLPAPLGPSNPKTEPFFIEKLMFSTAFCPAKYFLSDVTSIMGSIIVIADEKLRVKVVRR